MSWLRKKLVGLRDALAIRTGILRRPMPLHREFGWSRGTPIDRHYIEGFLGRHRADIRGAVLEAAVAPNYTQQFGGDRVTSGHILFPVAGEPGTTLIGDLETGIGIPPGAFDTIILTQVFQFIYGMSAAVRHSYRALKPGGVLLATFAGISQISRSDMVNWGEFWRVTDASARRLFGDVFGPENVTVETYGNVLAASAFLHAMVITDLTAGELDFNDPNYQVIVAVRAVKPS